MAEAGNIFLAEVMLYMVMGIAIVATVFSTVRSFWLSNKK